MTRLFPHPGDIVHGRISPHLDDKRHERIVVLCSAPRRGQQDRLGRSAGDQVCPVTAPVAVPVAVGRGAGGSLDESVLAEGAMTRSQPVLTLHMRPRALKSEYIPNSNLEGKG